MFLTCCTLFYYAITYSFCFISILPRLRICDILTKKSKCHIQKIVPFVTYEFAWERILNKYAVISPDKQNNNQKVSDCLSLIWSLFCFAYDLKTIYSSKMTIEYSDHVSHSHLRISSRIKHYGFFTFHKRWSPYSPAKHTWSDRLRLLLQSFLKLQTFLCNNYNGYFFYLQ